MQYEDLYLHLFIVITIYLGFLTVHLILKAIKSDPKGRKYLFSLSCFSGFYMLSRIMHNIDLGLFNRTNDLLYQLGSFFGIIGLFFYMYVIEKYIYQKLKYIPSICILICASLVLIFPSYNATNLITYWGIAAAVFGVLIPLLYLYIGLKSTGEVRKNSLFLAFAIIVFFVGKGLNIYALLDLVPLLRIIVPITMLCGLILIHYGLIR